MNVRRAQTQDLPYLVELMRGYYRTTASNSTSSGQPPRCCACCRNRSGGASIESGAENVGYVAICIGFSLELGGNDAFIDELFVLPEYRGQGHARRALEFVTNSAAGWGVAAVHLEVDRENLAAQRLYAELGYAKRDRYYFMTASLENSV
jgi:ribosomal protein S18 acetylase RimI-like enzyme